MNYSFQYIDIILLAMIAGFIFLRLRGILGKKTGFEGKIPSEIEKEFQKISKSLKSTSEKFDDEHQKDFLKPEHNEEKEKDMRASSTTRIARMRKTSIKREKNKIDMLKIM